MIIIIEFLLVGYLIYSLTKNVYNSYQVDKYITTFERDNAQIELENREKTDDYLYFTSEEYIDKIAKQNLGLVNPGEEVLIISSDVILLESDSADGLEDFAVYGGATNMASWWEFFFGD